MAEDMIEMKLDVKKAHRKMRLKEIEEGSGYLIGTSILFGVLYAFCMYKNPAGITYPLFVACGYCICISVFHRLEIPVKKESWFIVVISVLLAVSTCRTGDPLIIELNHTVIFLLACVYLLHHFYADRSWDLGKYMASIVIFLGTALSLIAYPVRHSIKYMSQMKNNKFRMLVLCGIGIGCAIPFMMILVFLLGQADVVFRNTMDYFMDTFLKPWTILSVGFKVLFGAVGMYCLICGAYIKNLKEESRNTRVREPLIAISGLSLIALIYLVFCSIQVVYLFLGSGSLPAGITYSSYARQGFFQLLFVTFMNLVVVLLSLKYFRKSKLLNFVLTVISGCTYIMLASAAYRMLLYIGEYHLSYLRVLVLWFLALLSILLAGVMILIYKNQFPLFRFCLVVVSGFYLGFAWMRPDSIIASYNISHNPHLEAYEIADMMYGMSVDAVPAVVGMQMSDELAKEISADGREGFLKEYYRMKVASHFENRSLRRYNFSYAAAERLLKESN